MPEHLRELLEHRYLGATGLQWLVATTIVVALTPLLILARRLLATRLRRLTTRSRTDIDDFLVTLVERTRGWFFALLSLRAATLVFDLPERWDHRAQNALVIGGMIQGGLWAGALVRYLVDHRFARAMNKDGHVVPVAQTLLRFAGLVIVWSIVLLAVLSSFGIDITALVAGLGVGGVAVALAVQTLLGDVLASISIAVDKPFSPGDYIALGEDQGTVRRVTLRSTVIGGLGGEELVIANNDLLRSRISNYTRMTERRVGFSVRVPYDTAEPLLEGLPALLRRVVETHGDRVRFDRATLTTLAESSLQYDVVYWVLSPDYGEFAKIHERVLLDLVREMRAAGHAFALPGRSVHIAAPTTTPEPVPMPTPEQRLADARAQPRGRP
jgi:small-conductance mechanosensitive channel